MTSKQHPSAWEMVKGSVMLGVIVWGAFYILSSGDNAAKHEPETKAQREVRRDAEAYLVTSYASWTGRYQGGICMSKRVNGAAYVLCGYPQYGDGALFEVITYGDGTFALDTVNGKATAMADRTQIPLIDSGNTPDAQTILAVFGSPPPPDPTARTVPPAGTN